MRHRFLVTLVVMALGLVGFSAGHASAAEFLGSQVSAGTTIPSATAVPGVLTFTNVQVSSTANGQVTASASMYAGVSTTPMAVSVQYANSDNWTISVQRNSAGALYQPPAGTSLDVNDVSGTITKSGGAVSYQLVLSGYTIGDATVDMTVHADRSGLEANAVVADMELASWTLESASITVSTASASADITASLETDAGHFDATLDVVGPGPLRGQRSPACSSGAMKSNAYCTAPPSPSYTVTLTVDGAELAGESSRFHMQSFGFSTTVDTMSYGCTYVDVAVHGQARIGNDTYTLKNAEVAFCGDVMDRFVFSVGFSHYQPWNRVTKSVDLTIAWSGLAGTFDSPTGGRVGYQDGFFGSVDLSAQRTFSKKYKGRTFHRNVTIGLAFGVAVYQASPNAAWTSLIGAGGYFDADRVSGAVGCVFQASPGTDMNCGGTLRLNPSWAGVYHYEWGDL